MGLDISVYENAVLTDPHEREDDCYDGAHVFTYIDDGFEHALGGLLRDRCYSVSGKTQGFRAGSYSGYNAWREELSKAALGVEPSVVWNDHDRWCDKPFFELINFSDCEGVIGPTVAAKLALDFQQQSETVKPKLAAVAEWYADMYETWQSAFELAADTGLVQFH
jgi:hypothetical protein